MIGQTQNDNIVLPSSFKSYSFVSKGGYKVILELIAS